MSYSSHKYHTEKFAVLMYVSQSKFRTTNENTKNISEYVTRAETQRKLVHLTVSDLRL
jgi:hypothetical protein